ncbi:rCG33871, partial [Rattus norvegicus]
MLFKVIYFFLETQQNG